MVLLAITVTFAVIYRTMPVVSARRFKDLIAYVTRKSHD
jgi:hypothetical protein